MVTGISFLVSLRQVWRYKRGNQKSKKDRQHNDQMKMDKMTNNDKKKNITQKTKDRVTRIPLKAGVNSGASEGWTVPAPYAYVAPIV